MATALSSSSFAEILKGLSGNLSGSGNVTSSMQQPSYGTTGTTGTGTVTNAFPFPTPSYRYMIEPFVKHMGCEIIAWEDSYDYALYNMFVKVIIGFKGITIEDNFLLSDIADKIILMCDKVKSTWNGKNQDTIAPKKFEDGLKIDGLTIPVKELQDMLYDVEEEAL